MKPSRLNILLRAFVPLLLLCGAGARAEVPLNFFEDIDVDVIADPLTFAEDTAVARDAEVDIWLKRFADSRSRNGAPRLLLGHGGRPRPDLSGNVDLDHISLYKEWRQKKNGTYAYEVRWLTTQQITNTFQSTLAPRQTGFAFWCNSQYQAAAITANTGRPTIGISNPIDPSHIFSDLRTQFPQAPGLKLNLLDRKNGLVTLNIPEAQNRNVVLGDKIYIPMSEVDRVFGPGPGGGGDVSNWKDKAKGGARGLRDWFLPGAAEAAAANQVARQIGYRTSAQIAGRTVVSVAPYAGVTIAIAGPPAVIVASDPSGQAPNNARRLAEAVPNIGSQATRNGFSIAGERLRSGASMLWSPIDSGLLERTWNGLSVGIPDRIEILYRSWTE